ncbi:L-fuculose-phosphate aldolase [Desulfonatronum thiosulfatophilum]|uniref:L-fuculose-phosphate aldolase n=1 Tax=Desulfonatronum thiosulfatophilum TaxID=617002 RepID=A0A1G6AN21_9BACT|nr:tRNA (N6-threonylcarbamoyladenosine(37)-N6)-methyltransferase TrmO [Desulfonatronum thiosulfatophilum]SDB09563.1 L-fuculose-phosphate aldolase [Desulfonatronum thiosulfatophilum]
MDITLTPIGFVDSPLKSLEDCPKQGLDGGPAARIVVASEYAAALEGLDSGMEVLVITWLHQAQRDTLKARARNNPDNPLTGVFALRSPNRPNPIGLHQVRIMRVDLEKGSLEVFPLEALDGTPVVDLKPVLEKNRSDVPDQGTPYGTPWGPRISAREGQLIKGMGRQAWERGLMAGLNGNISIRQGDAMVVTVSGCAKGRLQPGDLARVHLSSGNVLGPGQPSTEAALHRAVYSFQPKAHAILHVHPPYLLALSMNRTKGEMLDLPLFEADVWSRKMIRLAPLNPGCDDLAKQVGRAAMAYPAMFMEKHGLVCWGRDLNEALSLAEELESLARIVFLQSSMAKQT